VLWRIREQAVFARFRVEGTRVRHGALWMSWIEDESAVPPRVAFAIGRPVGSAVTRNQLRRRLRHVLRARARRLPPGWYLVGTTPAITGRSFQEIENDIDGCLARLGWA
jgi:ribonuclease P protein component